MSASKKRPEAVVQTPSPNIVMQPAPQGGVLRVGNPGNKGGGRKPAAIRKKALRMLANRMHLIGSLADGVAIEFTDEGGTKLVSPKPSERIQALKLLAELGLGEMVSTSEVRDRMRRQLDVIRTREHWTADELIEALGAVWR
jgi:hypothetical protein